MKRKASIVVRLLIVLLFATAAAVAQEQVVSKIISGEKQEYRAGDELTILFQLTVDPKSCQDGMSKTGIFSSGITIVSKSDWLELKKGLWQITLKCRMTGNKKGFGQLTVIRKTDKQNLFKQVKFEIK